MHIRYSSVDRSKEIRSRKELNPLYLGGNRIVGGNIFDINKYISQTEQSYSLQPVSPTKRNRRKLPSLNKKILSPPLFDKISKNSDLSTEANNIVSFDRDLNDKSIEKSSINYLNIDSNRDRKLRKNYYLKIINSSFSDRSSINNNTQSSLMTNFIKAQVRPKNKPFPIQHKYINERLYPQKPINAKSNYFNPLKAINEIKKNTAKLRLENKNADYFTKKPTIQSKVAYDPKYEDVVFEPNKLINDYNCKEKDLKLNENDVNDFISKNKQISINNVLINLMIEENKKLKRQNEINSKNIEDFEKIIEKDEENFDNYTSQQKDLYFKLGDMAEEINMEANNIRKLLFIYSTREKSLEDEIFKIIEQIDLLRIYAKFVHKVMEEDEKLFEEQIIPDYANDSRPEIYILINKVYEKYGHLLKKKKNDNNNNLLKLDENEENEDIDNDILSDPYLVIKKFKELEDLIIRAVQYSAKYNKPYNKESEEQQEIIQDMKNQINKLQKEYEKSKRSLFDYKKTEFGGISKSDEEYCAMIDDLCKAINDDNYKSIGINYKKIHMSQAQMLQLNDEIINSFNMLEKKEKIVNTYISQLEEYEKSELKIFNDLISKRKKEIKIINQNNIKQSLKEIEKEKKLKSEQKFNKIFVKSRKTEPPKHHEKKEVKIKIDPEDMVKKENEELLIGY